MRFGKEGHTFLPRTDVCIRCHGPEMRAERVQEGIKTLLHEVEAAIGAKVLAQKERIAAITGWGPQTDPVLVATQVELLQPSTHRDTPSAQLVDPKSVV